MPDLTLDRPRLPRRTPGRATGGRAPDATASSLAALDEAVLWAAHPDAPADPDALADWLYARWWAGAEVSLPRGDSRVGACDAARRSASGVDDGLLVLASDGTRIVVARRAGEAPRTLAADTVVGSSRPGCPARPGDLVSALRGTGGPDESDSWWWARCGPRAGSPDEHETRPIERWYVHARCHDVPLVVAATVRLAERTGVPLALKCPTRESGYGRRDALVIYTARADADRLAGGFASWWSEVRGHVDPATPPLTRPLAPGVAAAHDPGGHVSYGQLRCEQIADAITRLRAAPHADRLALLRQVGIDPAHPEEVAR